MKEKEKETNDGINETAEAERIDFQEAENRKAGLKKLNKEQLHKYAEALIDENEDLITQCIESETRAITSEMKSNEYLTKLTALKSDFDRQKTRNKDLAEESEEKGRLASVEKIFPILDTFERAAAQAEDAVLEVLSLVQRQFESVLADLLIEEIDVLGKPFDPNTSYAVIERPAENEDERQTVITVVSKGYAYKDRILRYPKVVVAV